MGNTTAARRALKAWLSCRCAARSSSSPLRAPRRCTSGPTKRSSAAPARSAGRRRRKRSIEGDDGGNEGTIAETGRRIHPRNGSALPRSSRGELRRGFARRRADAGRSLEDDVRRGEAGLRRPRRRLGRRSRRRVRRASRRFEAREESGQGDGQSDPEADEEDQKSGEESKKGDENAENVGQALSWSVLSLSGFCATRAVAASTRG